MVVRTHADVPSLSPAIEGRDPEALAIYVVLGLLGAVRLIVAIALGETFGGEDTIAIGMIVAAALGLAGRRSRSRSAAPARRRGSAAG